MALVGFTAAHSKTNKNPFSAKLNAPKRKLDHDSAPEWDESNINIEESKEENWEVYLFPEDQDLMEYFTTFP
jgi:hypothetical protein